MSYQPPYGQAPVYAPSRPSGGAISKVALIINALVVFITALPLLLFTLLGLAEMIHTRDISSLRNILVVPAFLIVFTNILNIPLSGVFTTISIVQLCRKRSFKVNIFSVVLGIVGLAACIVGIVLWNMLT